MSSYWLVKLSLAWAGVACADLPKGFLMSQLVDIATDVHEQHLTATQEGQEAFLRMAEICAAFIPAAPVLDMPERYLEALRPATEFFGTQADALDFMVGAARAWSQSVHDFSDAFLARVVIANA